MRCSCGKENPASATRCPQCGKSLEAGPDYRRWLIDALAAGGLVLALAIVYGIDRGSNSATGQTPAENVSITETTEATQPPGVYRSALRLAVTPHEYDDMGRLLGGLGKGYQYTKIGFDDLLSPERMAQYDVVFLTCGGVPKEWLGRRTGAGQRGSSGMFSLKQRVARQLKDALRQFVGKGGTLYVSDWQLQLLDVAFSEFVDQTRWTQGEVQTVRADVVDAGLRRRMGQSLDLRFDQVGWYAAAFQGADVTTYLEGAYKTSDGRQVKGPLLVKIPYENGSVVFTAFHNEAQNSQMEMELLRYLVFTTVTAREEANVKRTMVRGGFSPSERSLLSVSSGAEPVAQEYECRRAGPLQFVLGFEEQGAKLKLTVTGPDGARREQEGTRTFLIDIPEAATGTWRYSITPLEVPYQNFPFTLTIGEKQ